MFTPSERIPEARRCSWRGRCWVVAPCVSCTRRSRLWSPASCVAPRPAGEKRAWREEAVAPWPAPAASQTLVPTGAGALGPSAARLSRAPPAGPPAPRPGVRVRQHHQGSDFRGASGFPGQRQPAFHRPHGLPLTPAAPSRCLPPATFPAQCLVSCGAQPPV